MHSRRALFDSGKTLRRRSRELRAAVYPQSLLTTRKKDQDQDGGADADHCPVPEAPLR
jgi:hypothetical protein